MSRIGTGTKKPIILSRFIVFEGIDGAGTTTQIELFKERCLQEGIPLFSTQEPTTHLIGKTIRSILRGEAFVHPTTLPFLFAADRNEHLHGKEGILERLNEGYWVVSDRYLFSSLAYQSLESGYKLAKRLNESFPLPQCLFYIDVTPEEGIRRIQGRGVKEMYEFLQFQKRVSIQYRKVLSRYRNSGMEICILDGGLPMERVQEQVWTFFQKFRY